MSTRGFVGIRINGENKITYNHSDSYPGYIGVYVIHDLYDLLADEPNARRLAEDFELRHVAWSNPATDDEFDRCTKITDDGFLLKRNDDWYRLLIDVQGKLKLMLKLGLGYDASDLPSDGVQCAWGYLANFDDRCLEVFKGGMETNGEGRFADLTTTNTRGYPPVHLVGVLPFDKIMDDDFDSIAWIEALDIAWIESLDQEGC